MGNWSVLNWKESLSSEAIFQKRILTLLQLLASEQRPCRHSGQMLYFLTLPEGTTTTGAFRLKEHWTVAFTGDGENHAGHCPGTRQHAPQQQSLLGTTTNNGFDPD